LGVEKDLAAAFCSDGAIFTEAQPAMLMQIAVIDMIFFMINILKIWRLNKIFLAD
jgi:hypothetical protein